MGSLSRECREYLDKQPWDEIIPKVILYAARRLELYEWQGSRKGGPPMGRTAEDFVNEVIIGLYQGDGRTWDAKRHQYRRDSLRKGLWLKGLENPNP